VLAQSSLDGLNNDYELLEKEVQAAESYKNELKSKLEQIRKEK
jgi:outer membrane murein-binding lipoprotein Lpp